MPEDEKHKTPLIDFAEHVPAILVENSFKTLMELVAETKGLTVLRVQ